MCCKLGLASQMYYAHPDQVHLPSLPMNNRQHDVTLCQTCKKYEDPDKQQ